MEWSWGHSRSAHFSHPSSWLQIHGWTWLSQVWIDDLQLDKWLLFYNTKYQVAWYIQKLTCIVIEAENELTKRLYSLKNQGILRFIGYAQNDAVELGWHWTLYLLLWTSALRPHHARGPWTLVAATGTLRKLGGTFLVVQWFRLCTSNGGDMSSVPGWGTKTPHAVWHSQKKGGWNSYCWHLFPELAHIQARWGFPHSSVGKESACDAGYPSSIPGSRRDRLPTPVFLGFPCG